MKVTLNQVEYFYVQGLYPESHGIIDNNMFDFNISQKFSLTGSIKYNPQWWGGEPVSPDLFNCS